MARGAHKVRQNWSGSAHWRFEPVIQRDRKPFPWHAWPANDNNPPAWRAALGWAALGVGLGSFAFVTITLLL